MEEMPQLQTSSNQVFLSGYLEWNFHNGCNLFKHVLLFLLKTTVKKVLLFCKSTNMKWLIYIMYMYMHM